jgi:hypothetical protein
MFWSDTRGFIFPYVTMMIVVFIGLALLALDGSRYRSLQTQMQAAADALALAGARELNQRPGAITRATNAMANTAFGNDNTIFGFGTSPTLTYSTPVFYTNLPAATGSSATDYTGTQVSGTADQQDLAAKFVKVTVSAITVPTIMPVRLINAAGANSFSAGATAIAGFTAVTVCNVTPIFMCNPYEQSGDTDTQATQRLIDALDPNSPTFSSATLLKQFRLDRSSINPGNFGWVQTADCGNTDANCLKADLAKVAGACYSSFTIQLNTGNKNNVDPYWDTRFDIYQKSQDILQINAPSVNVRKGYVPGNNHDWCSASPYTSSSPAPAQATMTAFYGAPMTTTTGSTTSNSASITSVGNTSNIVFDSKYPMYVAGAGIPSPPVVATPPTVSGVSGSTVTMSNNATATATSNLTFYFPTGTPTLQYFDTTSGSNTLTPSTTTKTGITTTKNSAILTNVADTSCIAVGETVSGGKISGSPTVTAISGSTVTMSQPMGGNGTQNGATLIFSFPNNLGSIKTGEFIAGAGIPANTTVTNVTGTASISTSSNATVTSCATNSYGAFWLEAPLPHDSAWTGVADANGVNHQGNGNWNCALYWKANHPAQVAPAGCSSNAPTISRYQVYRYEIANNLINDWSGNHASNTSGNTGNGDNGAPLCAVGAHGLTAVDISVSTGTDRRNTIVPIINCLAQNVSGQGSNASVPAAAFAKFFITQPWSAESTYLYGEMTGLVASSDNVAILNQVQLYR